MRGEKNKNKTKQKQDTVLVDLTQEYRLKMGTRAPPASQYKGAAGRRPGGGTGLGLAGRNTKQNKTKQNTEYSLVEHGARTPTRTKTCSLLYPAYISGNAVEDMFMIDCSRELRRSEQPTVRCRLVLTTPVLGHKLFVLSSPSEHVWHPQRVCVVTCYVCISRNCRNAPHTRLSCVCLARGVATNSWFI